MTSRIFKTVVTRIFYHWRTQQSKARDCEVFITKRLAQQVSILGPIELANTYYRLADFEKFRLRKKLL